LLDYDNDGWLDIYLVNGSTYDALDGKAESPHAALFHNNHDGTFTDVAAKAGVTNDRWGFGVAIGDYDNDGWPDIYVANDSTKSLLYKNLKDGKFTEVGLEAGCVLSADGKPQAGMGVSAADYDLDGNLDIVKTNFAGDTPSLYRNLGNWNFEDATFQAGLGLHTQYLGWGCGFFDFDNDGWPDLLICNGHVYPEVEQLTTEAGYPHKKLLYKNTRNGRFREVTQYAGPGITVPNASRGCAFGDFDNDGDVDFAINTVNGLPQLVRCDSTLDNNWIKVKCIGVKSNRSAIGARLRCITTVTGEPKPHQQIDEVRSGGGYISQSDLRIHFGLGKAEKVDVLEVRWPSGQIDTVKDVKVNQLVHIKEGQGIIKTEVLPGIKKSKH
jgi:hypothetical protein